MRKAYSRRRNNSLQILGQYKACTDTRVTGVNPNQFSSKLDANKKYLKRTWCINLVNSAEWRELKKQFYDIQVYIPQRLIDSQKTLYPTSKQGHI